MVMFRLAIHLSRAMADNFDAIVIGGGPGGYNAAIRLGQLGEGRRADRVGALSLSKALCEADSAAKIGEAEAAMSRVLSAAGVQMEYAVVRDAQTLMPLPAGQGRISPGGPMRALIAARVGRVRLIDNAPWGSASERF